MLRQARLRFVSLNNGVRQAFCVVKTVNPPAPLGKLTLIPTPIGNMMDISPNMLRALFTADLIGCEDRRVAGQLYTLIQSKSIIDNMVECFGTFGISNLIPVDNPNNPYQFEKKQHLLYNYANMKEKERLKFLRKMTYEDQNAFKLDFLKYRAMKALNKKNEFILKKDTDKFQELYGIETSDLKHIETQINNCRVKKNRGLLIPLNTYSETKMFDMVRNLLETKNVAIVSDAGMPCISDPGWRMVSKIRETMPQVPIEVIGGPSSVGIMITLAALSSKDSTSLSGRFQGFASLSVAGVDKQTVEMNTIKENEFSINFINAKKLKKKVLELETVYGGKHKIMLANELTKKYERKFNGKIEELLQKMTQDDSFSSVGQVSYLIYPNDEEPSQQPLGQVKEARMETTAEIGSRTISISAEKLLAALQKSEQKLRSAEQIDLLRNVFHIKTGQARKIVYDKVRPNWNIKDYDDPRKEAPENPYPNPNSEQEFNKFTAGKVFTQDGRQVAPEKKSVKRKLTGL